MAKSRKPKRRGGGEAYFWDRLVASLAMVVDVLGVALGGAAMTYGFLDPKVAKLEQPMLIGGVGAFIVALGLIYFAIHLGMFKSRRWSFIVLALLAGYGLSSGSAGSSAFMLTYTVLRLGEVFGPPLK